MQPRLNHCLAPILGRENQTHRLHWVEWGPQDASQILWCVHGLTRNGRDFDAIAKRVAATGIRVICPDMAGRGESEWFSETADYRNEQYLADNFFLMQKLGVTTVDWLGTSMGGILGMMVAAMQPQTIKTLILNDVGAIVSAIGLNRIASYVGVMPSFKTYWMATLFVAAILKPFGVRRWHDIRHFARYGLKQGADRRWRLNYDPKITDAFMAARGSKEHFEDIDLLPVWSQIKCPVLVIRGEDSDLLLEQTVKIMSRPGVEHITVPDTGHAPMLLGKPEQDAILSIIKK